MDRHVQLIGILWIVYGLLGLLFAFFVFLVLFGVSFIPEMGDITPGILRFVAWASSLFFLALAIPQIIAGLGLLKRKEWARILTLIVSFFHLLSIPLGTALGIYSFVILLKPEAIKLFNPTP
jgi:glucan phosphoethanolaminetransferase (alkaline phosphatase superfamily)